jgi:non-heme chloroperoxidase
VQVQPKSESSRGGIAHDRRGHGRSSQSERDFTEDLKKFDVPTLIMHGDDDQIVPIGASAMLSSKLVKNAQLKIYKGGSHSLKDTSKERLNTDLLAFLKS